MHLFNALRVSRAPAAALASVGVFWGGISAMMPDIKSGVGAGDAELGAVLLASAGGGMLAMYLAPRLSAILGRVLVPLAGLVLAFAFAYPVLAGSISGLAVAFFGVGLSVATLDIAANVRISALEARRGLHLMNVNHAMFSFAFCGSAFATGLARKAGFGPAEVFVWLSLVCVGLAVLTWEGRGALDAGGEDDPDPSARMPWAVILWTALILFAAFITENATEAWSALHIERTLGAAVGEGGFGPAVLGLSMGIGRLAGQVTAERLGEERLVLVSALLAALGAFVIALAPSAWVALAGVGALGLGMAVIVPSANSILGKRVRHDQRAFALSRAWMFGFTGFFIGPSMMGLIAEHVSLRGSFMATGVLVCMIVPAVLALQKTGARNRAPV